MLTVITENEIKIKGNLEPLIEDDTDMDLLSASLSQKLGYKVVAERTDDKVFIRRLLID